MRFLFTTLAGSGHFHPLGVRAIFADPSYRLNAERARDEIAALPGPERAVELLERLATNRAPIPAA